LTLQAIYIPEPHNAGMIAPVLPWRYDFAAQSTKPLRRLLEEIPLWSFRDHSLGLFLLDSFDDRGVGLPKMVPDNTESSLKYFLHRLLRETIHLAQAMQSIDGGTCHNYP